MFLKLQTKYGTVIVNSDNVSYIENNIEDFIENPVDKFNFGFIFKNGDRRLFFFETEEIKNQEFDWIMSKLDVVQNVSETIIDSDDISIIANFNGDYREDVAQNIINLVKDYGGVKTVMMVARDEHTYITGTRFRSGEEYSIADYCVVECSKLFDKELYYRVKK